MIVGDSDGIVEVSLNYTTTTTTTAGEPSY